MDQRSPLPIDGLAMLLGAACGPATPGGSSGPGSGAPTITRTLVIVSGGELPSFAPKPLSPEASSARAGIGKSTLNAVLTYMDQRGVPQPFLAESLPELSSDTWRVFPDGSMETT